jgi:hypothetical protein
LIGKDTLNVYNVGLNPTLAANLTGVDMFSLANQGLRTWQLPSGATIIFNEDETVVQYFDTTGIK